MASPRVVFAGRALARCGQGLFDAGLKRAACAADLSAARRLPSVFSRFVVCSLPTRALRPFNGSSYLTVPIQGLLGLSPAFLLARPAMVNNASVSIPFCHFCPRFW